MWTDISKHLDATHVLQPKTHATQINRNKLWSNEFIIWLLSFAFLLTERTFEDHENLVEPLLAWTRDSENKILFQERPGKNEVFKNPQVGPLIVLHVSLYARTERSDLVYPTMAGSLFLASLCADLSPRCLSLVPSGSFHCVSYEKSFLCVGWPLTFTSSL